MDIITRLKEVRNVDGYISVTQEIANKGKNLNVQLNLDTAFVLNKFGSLEVEYLNKCYDNGGVCLIFEHLLTLPPSKTWGVLAKDLVTLLQYWLNAIRRHLIEHSVHWWRFLKLVLKFIKDIQPKDPTIPNILVELTAEGLLDIASRDKPDAYQRHEILHCLNLYCADASREIRFALRTKFGNYFKKLSWYLLTCGYLPCQHSALEAAVRWLLPRRDAALRAAAAARWLPPHLCPQAAIHVFLNATWMDFLQDSRNFLNAVNEANGLVTSMPCRRLTVGKILVISDAENQQAWLDINSNGRSISILLEPRILEHCGLSHHKSCETLTIAGVDTETALLQSQSHELTISLTTYRPVRVLPSDVTVDGSCDVTIAVSSRTNLQALNTALRAVFEDKYHLLMDLEAEISLSPPRPRGVRRTENSSEEDTKFSHPVEVKRRRHAGYIVSSKGGLASPSTASTSSLAQLHDKLAALPRYRYDKEPVSVCAQPQLSNVTEISEVDDRSSRTDSTLTFRPYGVCHKNLQLRTIEPPKKKAASDSEAPKIRTKVGRRLSPVVSDENSTSCLLVATIGSADDSVINDTLERLSKKKEFKNDNIVDLLVQEALQAKTAELQKTIDNYITNENKQGQENEENSEAIENTPIEEDVKETYRRSRVTRKKICTVVSKSTTDDESNTEAINETPVFVSLRKGKQNHKLNDSTTTETKVPDKQGFDVQIVEQFFSQHFAETKAGELMISPSLAKKINESSSETSENFDEQYLIMNEDINPDVEQVEINDIDILECLNDMVDKVCSDFEKCTEYLNKNDIMDNSEVGSLIDKNKGLKKTRVIKIPKPIEPETKPKGSVKLKYNDTVKKEKPKTRAVTKKLKLNTEQKTVKMSTIIEQKDEDIVVSSPIRENTDIGTANIATTKGKEKLGKNDNMQTPVMKRKRKLYSPKDNEEEKGDKREIKISEADDDDDDIALADFKTRKITKTLKTTDSCYKDIERIRQNHIRLPRSRKSRGKVAECPSPRTLKMNSVFDKLKETVESNEKIVLADKGIAKTDVYNFTSDSEDEDFKKKIVVKNRTSNTTVGSFENGMSTRFGRSRTRANFSEKSSTDETKKTKPVRRRKTVKKTSRANTNTEAVNILVDERMRKTEPDLLNASIVFHKSNPTEPADIDLILKESPRMEPIPNEEVAATAIKKSTKRSKKAEILSLKKEKGIKKNELKLVSDKEDDRTVSPLPGLVVEPIPTREDDANDCVTDAMFQKLKKIHREGPDANNESSNTQNLLLSDNERCSYSLQNVFVNNIDEIFFVDYNKEHLETMKERTDKNKQNKDRRHDKSDTFKNKKSIKIEKVSLTKNASGEIIEISEPTDVKSDMSIATDGINAHGDIDQAPPSPEMIKKGMQPREIEDLDESMKNYFVKLTREINNSDSKEHRDSKCTGDREVKGMICNRSEKSSSLKSPVVSVKRLSFDDISKWLPSRRTSETDSSESSQVVRDTYESVMYKDSQKFDEQVPKNTSKDRNTSTETIKLNKKTDKEIKQTETISPDKSPVHIGRISLEEFNKWLPMPESSLQHESKTEFSVFQDNRRNSLKLVYNTRQRSKTNKDRPEVKISIDKKTIEKKSKTNTMSKLHVIGEGKDNTVETVPSHATESDGAKFSDKQTKNTLKSKDKSVTITRDTDSEDSDTTLAKVALSVKSKRYSKSIKEVISPVKPFGNSVTIQNDDPDDDECIKKIRSIFSKKIEVERKDKLKNVNTKYKNSDSISTQKSRDRTKPKLKESQESTSTKKMPQDLTLTNLRDHLDSTSTTVNESFKGMKRTSPLPSEAKKRRIQTNIDAVTIESGPSISSVNDWFRRMEYTKTRESDTSLSFRDTIQNVMEKLDTTLVEVNQNTSTKFVNLFVETQMRLSNQKEERRKMYKEVATDVISQMVALMDEKLADLDRRFQEMDSNFMERLKKKAFDLISEDCKQKRAMVLLLKEDVQAVVDHIAKI